MVVAVAGIIFGIVWNWKARNARAEWIRGGVCIAIVVVLAVRMRIESDWLNVILLVLTWQIAPWCGIVLWRRFANKEGPETAKE